MICALGVHHVGPGATSTRREHQYPGNIGSQKLSPRKSKVADKATATSIPTIRSINTDVASNVPSPPGTIPIVRNRLAIMKLTNTPPTDAVTPNARMSIQTVAASRSTIAP